VSQYDVNRRQSNKITQANNRCTRFFFIQQYIQFCAIHPHEGRNAMYGLSTKLEYATEYATDITLGRIVLVFIHSILTRFCGSVYLIAVSLTSSYVNWDFFDTRGPLKRSPF
jgi:hypothetical protein